MPSGVEEFIERVVQSGLMSMRDVAEFHRTLGPDKRSDPELFAKELVRARKLTKFQASAIYQGKTQGLVFGDYFVLDKIGVGGMGKVFKARHRVTGDIVALKVMSSTAMKSAKAIRRFQQETEVAKRLRHPSIVATYSSGELEGLHYLIMQFIDGDNLRSEVKSRGPLPINDVIDYTIQAAKGLEYAHSEGAVHRDIKPSNLLLDKSGAVMILDMGLARIEDPDDEDDAGRLTQQGQMLGTAEYMSPEQVEDPRLANAASDIYSLGCTMYYILTGAPPFRGTSVPETLIMHARDAIPKLRSRRPDATPELEAVYEKMMAKRPSNRFQSMTEVINALEAVRNGKAREPALPTMEFAPDDPMATPTKRPSDPNIKAPTGTEGDMTHAASRDLSLEKNVSLPGLPSTPEPQRSLSAFDLPHDQTLELMRRQQMMTWLLVGLVGLVAILLAVIIIMFLNQPK